MTVRMGSSRSHFTLGARGKGYLVFQFSQKQRDNLGPLSSSNQAPSLCSRLSALWDGGACRRRLSEWAIKSLSENLGRGLYTPPPHLTPNLPSRIKIAMFGCHSGYEPAGWMPTPLSDAAMRTTSVPRGEALQSYELFLTCQKCTHQWCRTSLYLRTAWEGFSAGLDVSSLLFFFPNTCSIFLNFCCK